MVIFKSTIIFHEVIAWYDILFKVAFYIEFIEALYHHSFNQIRSKDKYNDILRQQKASQLRDNLQSSTFHK